MLVGIPLATAGVFVMSHQSGERTWNPRAVVLGLASGGLYGLAAVRFRGAILTLLPTSYVTAAALTGVIGLAVPALVLAAWLAWRERTALAAIDQQWRPSLFAGFLGAFASQFWFMAFALATAASVRTLALVEVLFAQGVSHALFRQRLSTREASGIGLMVAGVAPVAERLR